jgi:hypothetical protein
MHSTQRHGLVGNKTSCTTSNPIELIPLVAPSIPSIVAVGHPTKIHKRLSRPECTSRVLALAIDCERLHKRGTRGSHAENENCTALDCTHQTTLDSVHDLTTALFLCCFAKQTVCSMRWTLATLLCALVSPSYAEKEATAPPPFFVQDPTDSLCLAGEEFKRCSIDTLFYVVGSPGTYP